MQENDFEKNVQHRMDELQLYPSAEVWPEVERRIRKEKKRRFIFWWPLFFLLVGGGIAAGILFTNKKEKAGEITAKNNTAKKLQSPPVKTIVPKPVQTLTSTDTRDIPGSRNDTGIIKEDNSEAKITSGNGVKTRLPANKPAVKEPAMIEKWEKNNPGITKENLIITEKQNTDQNNPPAVTTVVQLKPVNDLPDSTRGSDIAVVEKKEIQQKNRQEPPPQTTDSIKKEQKTKATDKKSKKWDWGITLSGGGSTTVNGLHFFDNKLYSNSSLQLLGSPGTSDSRNSSIIRPSASFGAGLYIKRPVSKKLDINIGLSYSYLSTKMTVGNRVDSARVINNYYSQGLSVNNFYRPAGNSSYTNRYHFIGLSGDISWRIINGNALKVYWDNGLSYNRLLGSSMLHFDFNLPGYYKDNKRLIKDQLFFSTGLSIPVSKRIIINPFASYSLTPVLKNSDSLRTHYTNYGIRFRLLLNKK